MHGFGMGFGWLIWIILILGLFWVIANYFNRSHDHSEPANDSSLEILNKRYANGEISLKEFHKMKRELLS
jgi:putative membrane protein